MEDAAIAGTQDKPPSAGMKVRLEHMNSGLFFHLKRCYPQICGQLPISRTLVMQSPVAIEPMTRATK